MSQATLPITTLIGFLLIPNYSMIALTSAIDVLRLANQLSGTQLYRWLVVNSGDQEQIEASNGLSIARTHQISSLHTCQTVFVCGGTEVAANTGQSLLTTLRALSSQGKPLGALCTGSYALARAGLLKGYRSTIHWENLAAMHEIFPEVEFTQEVFLIDRDRYTASGGTAPLHLMLHLVGQAHGTALANAISEQCVLERIRAPGEHQTAPQPDCIGPGYQHLREAIAIMSSNLEEPLPLAQIASLAGISLRQLERLYQRYHGSGPAQFYLRLRLRRARALLSMTSMSVIQVGVACGFSSSSHFCKAYRTQFGASPSRLRRQGAIRRPALPDSSQDLVEAI